MSLHRVRQSRVQSRGRIFLVRGKKSSGKTSVGFPWVVAARNAGRLRLEGRLWTLRSASEPSVGRPTTRNGIPSLPLLELHTPARAGNGSWVTDRPWEVADIVLQDWETTHEHR
jgi:hypothetical protein